jgi:site-specific DNA recombinase
MEAIMKQKALGYCRVSTIEQANEGISMDNQAAKIRQYCELNDLELVEIISDDGESGKDLKRDGVKSMLTRLQEVDAIVVYKLDRLSRNVLDTLTVIQTFEKEKIAFHSIIDRIDTKTAMGKFFLHITASLAEMERDLIAERTKDALRFKKSNGELVGSVPYGKRLAADGVKLQDDPDEQETVTLIKKMRRSGATYRKICQRMTKLERKSRGEKWHPQTIKNIVGGAL